MGCFNSKPDDDGQNVAKAASNPLVKGAAKGPYGATAGAGGNAGAGSHLAPDAVARNISTGGVTAVPGRVVWIGHSAGSDRRHVGYDMLYRVLSIYCGAGSGLVVGDVVSSDPYARVRYQDKILATEVQRSTLNPEWRQWLHFVGVESGGPWGNYLLHVLDRDTVGSDDSLGGVLVDITDDDRKLLPRPRWLPLENTPSGQVHVITMAHKFGLMTVTLRKVTITADTLAGNATDIGVNILHMNRIITFSKQPVRSKSTADWAETQSFWASVDKDAPCIMEIVARRAGADDDVVLASCQFLAREYVNVKGSLVSLPLHRGTAGAHGPTLAQLEVAVGQVTLEINVDGGGERGLATEQHAPGLVAAVHHAALGLSSATASQAAPSEVLFYPTWTNPEAKAEEMTPANRQLLELVDANPVCADCGSTQPPATWVVMSANADNPFATFVCPRCVGVHRGIGAERIVPKSATLDPEYFTAEVVQRVVEGRAQAESKGLMTKCCDANAPRADREQAIRSKYGFEASAGGQGAAVGPAKTHLVKVTVVKADNLVNKDTLSKSDPYVIVKFGNETGRVQVSRTTTKNNTLNPVYNETLANMMWDGVSPLHINVMDSDVMFDDPLGHASVCLEGIPSHIEEPQTVTVPLQGVATGTVTLRIVHYDYAELEGGRDTAVRFLRA